MDAFREICCLHTAVVGHPARDGREGGRRREFDATRGFARSATAPGDARRFVVETLRAHEWDELVVDASLVVAELASNAVAHAQSNFTVSLAGSSQSVRILVRDAGAALPVPREATKSAPSGRGLSIVTALTTEWGTSPLDTGKVVWAELRRLPTA